MKEYTVFSSAAAVFGFLLDQLLGTKVFKTKPFWIFMAIMTFSEMVVNGYLTSRPVFLYGERFISGLKLGTIPIEDFIFGFAFIALVIILWEFFKRRERFL